jgi:hypothetical protein
MVGKTFLTSKKYKHENLKNIFFVLFYMNFFIILFEFYGLAEPLPIDERCSIELE